MNPKVSIIMGVYNREEVTGKTIESVLNQTFKDFEFIIIEDGSTDSTQDIIKEYTLKDNRIILLENEKNVGLTKGLNQGIKLARGDYIARIDAGDLWDKIKLEKQIKFLEENKEYVICGTQTIYIDEKGKIFGRSSYKKTDKDIRKNLFARETIFLHPSIVFRNVKIYYREFFKYSQDLDLYTRLFFKGKFYCLPEFLTFYRLSFSNLTIKKRYYQRQYQNIARKLFRERIKYGKDRLDMGKFPTIKENKIGLKFCNWSMFFSLCYQKTKLSKKSFLLWFFYLILACLIYPPFILDYLRKVGSIILYKKLKLNPVKPKTVIFIRRKLNLSLFIKTILYLKYLPYIIFKIKNWYSFILNYMGIKDKACTYILRNGLKIKTNNGISSGTIAVVFIKKDYGDVDDNSVVIDIGANMGVYSVFAAQSKNTIVYAYEPMFDNFNLLKENIKSNELEKNISLFNLAVGVRKEKRRLYLGTSPFHSFYSIKESPFNSFYGDYSKEKKQKYIEVNCISLKDVFNENKIDQCDILKLDCEGAEFEILYNLPDEYFKKIKKIRLEYHNHSINKRNNGGYLIEFLKQKGFKLKRFKKGSDYQGDLWFEI